VIPDIEEEEERLLATLAASSQSTIARINYRFSPDLTWPTPLHDVLTGYDWIFENLLLDRPPLARLGVCGELVGGSLATSLALTECQVGESRIVAAAVNNPIADWVFPDDLPVVEPAKLPEPNAPEETSFPADQDIMTWWAQQDANEDQETPAKPGKQRKKKAAKPTAWELNSDNKIIPSLTLSGERDVLFTKPVHYFDRFASPIHFFRSPNGKLIYPESDDIFASSSPSDRPRDSLDIETQMNINHFQAFDAADDTPPVPTLVRCRAYARIYPPSESNLILPQWHINTGSQSPLLDQTSELAKLIKRSIARYSLRSRTARTMWHDPAEKEKYEAYAEEAVQLHTSEGLGLWTMSDGLNPSSQIENVGLWMKHCLAP
jgi:hypothetical protein